MLVTASFYGCANDRKQGEEVQDISLGQKPKETWDDFQRRKDSLWTVFNESTDEAEVDKARVMLFDMGCNADWGMIVSTDYERRNTGIKMKNTKIKNAFC